MRLNYNFLLVLFMVFPLANYGQNHVSKDSIIKHLNYEIINIDTVVTHYVIGVNPPYRTDSTSIWADIILKDAPNKMDTIQLKLKIETIMRENHINNAFVFRNEASSYFFRLSSDWAYKQLKAWDGYLGQFKL